jgi:hypothetical protein
MKPMAAASLAFFCGLVALPGCDVGSNQPLSGSRGLTASNSKPFEKPAEEIWQRKIAQRSLNNGAGEIRAVRNGAAEISLDDGRSWKSAREGMRFAGGAIIRTDERASADLLLEMNGGTLRLGPGSFLRVVRLDVESTGLEKVFDTMIELEKGAVAGNLSKLAAASSFLVRTHRGVVQPIGNFEVEAEGGVIADGGQVYAGGENHKLEAGRKVLF